MAELMFKRGKQSALNTIITNKTAIDGCFYLTEDTNRLYVGQGDNTAPILLNQTVQIVDNIASLPASPPATKNDFYYCVAENILAVYNGEKWVQINPDTNTDARITGASFSEGVKVEGENKITYTLTLNQQNVLVNSGDVIEDDNVKNTITAELVLDSSAISSLVPEAATVGLSATAIDTADAKGVQIATEGDGSNPSNNITLVGGVSLDENGNIVINDTKNTTYELCAVKEDSVVKLRLHDETVGGDQDIVFGVNDSNDDLIVDSSADTILYGHKTYNTESTSVTNEASLVAKDKINIISGIEVSNGHITNIETASISLPDDVHLDRVVNDDTTDWSLTLVETTGTEFNISFASDAEAMRTALEKKIEDGLAAANTAMTYRGTVNSYDVLPTKEDGVEVGDVYLLAYDDGTEYAKGDMFIATSSDNADTGVIDSGDLIWTHVPSGDELNTDTLFRGDVTIDSSATNVDGGQGKVSYAVKAVANAAGDDLTPEDSETLELNAGKDIVINGTDASAVISHKVISTTKGDSTNSATNCSFVAVSDVVVDNGHITEVKYEKFTPTMRKLEGTDNKLQLVDEDSGSITSTVEVAGDNWISATVSDNKFNISHNAAIAENATVVSVENESQLQAKGNLEILSNVSYDANGHIVDIEKTSLVLPEDNDTTYQLLTTADNQGDTAANETADPYLVLKDKNGTVTYTQLLGDGGSVSVVGNTSNIKISMVWGSF